MSIKRPSELGLLFTVGGPGGSGSSTIAIMLAQHFKLNHIYAGKLMRDIAKSKGFSNYNDFLENTPKDVLEKYDFEVDKKLIKFSFNKDVLVEGKVFSALCTKYRIATTVKIWVAASLEVRAKRKYLKYGGNIETIKEDLNDRLRYDKERYNDQYGIDYLNPKKYNDIVIDTSNMNEYQTFNLILKLIEDGRYIRK